MLLMSPLIKIASFSSSANYRVIFIILDLFTFLSMIRNFYAVEIEYVTPRQVPTFTMSWQNAHSIRDKYAEEKYFVVWSY